jgi:RecB family exonuclease
MAEMSTASYAHRILALCLCHTKLYHFSKKRFFSTPHSFSEAATAYERAAAHNSIAAGDVSILLVLVATR